MTTIRHMTDPDISQVLDIERRVYPDPWPEKVFREELAASNRIYLVAVEGEALCGYAGLMAVGDDAHITTIAVDAEWQGRGIGTGLMVALIDAALASEARNLTLEVRVSNVRAQALYRRFGMAPVGVRRGYYRSEDALIMWAHDISDERFRARVDAARKATA